jgi:hypothetical protein
MMHFLNGPFTVMFILGFFGSSRNLTSSEHPPHPLLPDPEHFLMQDTSRDLKPIQNVQVILVNRKKYNDCWIGMKVSTVDSKQDQLFH